MNESLLSLLICPVSQGPLYWVASQHELISPQAQLAFPVNDGIPLLLMQSARPLAPNEWENLKTKLDV